MTPKDIRHAIKFPSACSGATLSDRVAIDGLNTISCFLCVYIFPVNWGQHWSRQTSKETEQTNNVSQMPPTEDDISDGMRLQMQIYTETLRYLPYSIRKIVTSTVSGTPPQAAMMRDDCFVPPPPPRPHQAMIHFILSIPEELLVPVF
jgi:hypothetical protein